MRSQRKLIACLFFGVLFLVILPTALADTHSGILSPSGSSHTRRVQPSEHWGRLDFTFSANGSLTVSITDDPGIQLLWSKVGTNGSYAADVDSSKVYKITLYNGGGDYVSFTYTIVENTPIPAFPLVFSIFTILALIGFVSLKRRQALVKS